MMTNSSVCEYGDYVTQIIHFIGGEKRTFNGCKTSTIKDGSFTKIELKNGSMIMINSSNVLLVEIIPE